MSDESDEGPAVSQLDSDAILIGAYCAKLEIAELRRYIAIDLVTALQPLTKDSIKTAREIESFLIGEPEKKARLKVVDE